MARQRDNIQALSLELDDFDSRIAGLKLELSEEAKRPSSQEPPPEAGTRLDTLLDGTFTIDCGDLFGVGDEGYG
eukprot:7684203-Pyramimonas_sp.AAC.1